MKVRVCPQSSLPEAITPSTAAAPFDPRWRLMGAKQMCQHNSQLVLTMPPTLTNLTFVHRVRTECCKEVKVKQYFVSVMHVNIKISPTIIMARKGSHDASWGNKHQTSLGSLFNNHNNKLGHAIIRTRKRVTHPHSSLFSQFLHQHPPMSNTRL